MILGSGTAKRSAREQVGDGLGRARRPEARELWRCVLQVAQQEIGTLRRLD